MMQYQTKETMDKTQDWTKDQAKQDTKRPRQAKQEQQGANKRTGEEKQMTAV